MPVPVKRNAKDKKPNSEYISLLIQAGLDEFGGLAVADAMRDSLYWQTNTIEHPAHVDFQAVHFGIATETVERIRGILDDFPTVQVSVTSLAPRESERATDIEDFLNTIFLGMMDDQDDDIWDHVVEDSVRFGRGYDQLLYIPDVRSDKAADFPRPGKGEEDRSYKKRLDDWSRHAKLPIVWRHIPARQVFVWRDENGISECLIIDERRVRDILNRYPEKVLAALRKTVSEHTESLFGRVFLVEYWNRSYGAYWVSEVPESHGRPQDIGLSELRSVAGEIADVFDNIYGYVPLIETPGITTTSRNASQHHLSVIDHLAPIAEYLDQLLSQKATAIRQWAWATPYVKQTGPASQLGAPLPPDERPEPVDIEVGKMNVLLPGEDLGWFVPPDIGAGADEQAQIIMKQADTLGISSSLFSGGALASNGYLYNSVMNAIRSKYSPILRHIKRAHKQRCQQLLRIL